MSDQKQRRLNQLEAAVKALDERFERIEKISDHNTKIHQDVTAMMGAEVTILRRILEDMVRGETLMVAVGKIDFDSYLHQYNAQVKQELIAKEEQEVAEKTAKPYVEEVYEFGGDYVKDERAGQKPA